MKLVYTEHFIDNTEHQDDVFDYCMSIRGEVFKASPGRTVYRFIHRHYPYFIKIHTGVGWVEILKNLSQGKLPVLGANNEWAAMARLRMMGLNTLKPVGYGVRGSNPAKQESFLITHELTDTVSLEELTAHWHGVSPNIVVKRALINELASVMKIMHEGGVNHRDCYLCHFRLEMKGGFAALRLDKLKLVVIDLHRAQIRRKIPTRWQVKDLAGLYFSSKNIGLTRGDLWRFMKAYTGKSCRDIVASQAALWRNVEKVGDALHEKHRIKREKS